MTEEQTDLIETKPSAGEPVPDSAAPAASTEETSAAAVQKEIEKYRDLALRAQADLENFKKRSAREKADQERYGNARVLEALLPVIDSLDLGLQAARATEGGSSGVVPGFEMVRKQLGDFLRKQGVEEIAPEEGTLFDPRVHEAVGHEPSRDYAEGSVLRVLRPGFQLRDRLLRPASVVVSKGDAAS